MWRRLPSSYHHPNTALIDPVAIQKPYDIRPNSRSLKTLEAQNAANTATTSSDVSPAARVVAKTLTSGRPDAHRARERGVQGLCAYRKVLTVGDASNTLSAIRHSATDLAIDAIDGTPGNIELNTVGFHVGGGTRVSLTHGGIVGAWDILDVSQYNDVNPDAPGIIRSRAIVLGQTEAGAATDHHRQSERRHIRRRSG
jgi:hypothetical protein